MSGHEFDCNQECSEGLCRQISIGTPDGTTCGIGSAEICVGGMCVAARCGDGFVDRSATPPEYCDDGNTNDNDGCSNSCTRNCVLPAPQCEDGNPCNGEEACAGDGLCTTTPAPAEGAPCRIGAETGVCDSGRCTVR